MFPSGTEKCNLVKSLLTCVALLIIVLPALSSAVSNESVTIGNTVVNPGTSFSLPIFVGNVTNMSSLSMVLVFDPSLLSADSIVVNDTLSGSKLTYYLNNSTGFANMTLSSVDVSAEGQVHVADVVFFALTSGMSDIIPENVSFENDTIFYPAEFVSNGSVRINYPPVINDIDDKVIIAGSELSFSVSATDADDLVLTYGVEGLPFGYDLNFETGYFKWIPAEADIGTHIVNFSVSDSYAFDFTQVNITVNELVIVDTPPQLEPIDNKYVNENETLSFNVTAIDPEEDAIEYSASMLPEDSSFDTSSGAFIWMPDFDDAGTYLVEFTATANDLSDSENVTITVNNVNHDPKLLNIKSQTVNEGSILEFTIGASDPDGDTLEFGMNGLPPEATLNAVTGEFFWTPDYEDAKVYDVEFSVSDGSLSDSENITITVTNVNRVPVLDLIGDRSVSEDSALIITLSATDADEGDSLTYHTNATFGTLDGNVFIWDTGYGDAGRYIVEFNVTDGMAVDSEIVEITVDDVNRAPELAHIGAQSVNEAEILTITLSATDADEGDSLTYNTNASFGTLDDNVFTWDTGYGDSGTYVVEFNVSDGIAVYSEVVEITVDDVNRAPDLDLIGDRRVSEDSPLIIILSGSDADKDPLTYGTNASFGTLTDNVFVWTPDYDDAGTYIVEFSVSDGLSVDSEIIAITVTDFNRAPELDLIGDRSVSEDSLLSIALSGSDADNDFLIYNTNASFGTLTGNVFEWTPDFGDCGTYIVEFSVSDGLSVDSEIITITVTDVNRAPMLMVIGSQSVDENKTLTIIPDATDDDDDTLYYSLVDSPSGSKIDETTGKFIWTPTYDQAGSYVIRFVVSDGFLKDTEDVTVTVNDVNRPPVMNAPDKVVVSENATVILDLNASDPDDDVLEYSTDASFGTLQGTLFSWTPGYEDAGIYPVTFTVNDAEFKVSKTVTINVTNSNSAPVLYSISDILVNELETVNIALEAVDIDGDELKFSKDVQYGDLEGNIFTWTPGINDSGFHKILFTVTDGQLSDSKTGTIAVGNTNIPPIIGYMEDQQVKENEMLVFTLNASDIDNDTLTYSASDLPAGADIGISNGTFTWIPTYDQAGTYTVEFMVSDKIYTAFDTVLIDVENVNRGPAFGYISGHTINETETLVIDLNATDPDRDAITFSTTSKKGDVIGDSFMWTTGYYDSGDYDIDFKVTDGHLTDNTTVHISVCQTNMPPEFEYIGSYIISEYETLQFSVKANDGDNDPLTYSVSGLPQVSSFNTSTGDFIWKPDYTQSGTYSVEFQVTDGKLNASRAVSISVMDVDKTSNPSIYGFTSSSSSSGGGGSSGGSEDYENIDYMDYSMKYITQGMDIVYEFPNDENDIEYVKFRAQKAASLTKAVIEILKDRSALVSSSPSGTVYRYINIWVGDAKFNSAGYFSSAQISFKVEKKWLSENNADPATIKLYRYSAGSWKELQTSKTGVDDTYYYYKALTSGFSSFSIVSKEKIPVSISTVKKSTVEDVKYSYEIESRFEPEVFDSTATATNMALEPSSTSSLNLGMFLMGIFGIIAIGSVLSYRSRNESLVLSRYYSTLYAVSISVKNATKLENIRSTDYRSLYDIIIAEIKGELKK
ncbi:Ig-like domain-containing protein [Methanolobus vulcani]|uniref:Tandem-95 repeat protein n=1 Tax=Methanolobus vulcani TaxID=38026 RepID=A0A7Z8P286_9EURY|nr:Ig-like domain-containing protein [Methanolobus vulcani]TQD25169.1 tandem-95 repeat protein [Methanolobus vulcani]